MERPYTTNGVSSLNPAHGEVYSIQHYVIRFVRDLRQVGCSLHVPRFLQPNETDHHNINETFFKSGVKHHNLNLIQLSPLLECDRTVCLPEKSKVTRGLCENIRYNI
jgi:predicted aconitase